MFCIILQRIVIFQIKNGDENKVTRVLVYVNYWAVYLPLLQGTYKKS